MRSTNENAAKWSAMRGNSVRACAAAARGASVGGVHPASCCAAMTSLAKVVVVKRRGMSLTLVGVLKRSAGTSDRYSLSCARPTSVTMPFCSNSASVSVPRAFSTILPRGIFTLNARSRRNTMSRKSIDSASRSSISDASGFTSSTSQPRASAIVADTVGSTAAISSPEIFACVIFVAPLFHFEPAVDREHLPGDVIRVRRNEEPHGERDVFRPPVPLEQDASLHLVARHLAHVARHLRVDHAGCDAIDVDLARCELDGE